MSKSDLIPGVPHRGLFVPSVKLQWKASSRLGDETGHQIHEVNHTNQKSEA